MVYPGEGETITVTINGNPQTTTIDDNTGDFNIIYNPSAIPASGTPYTITYGYVGDATLNGATNTGTSLTVNKAVLTVTPNAVSTPFSDVALNNAGYSDNTANYTISGFQNGQTLGTSGVTLSGLMAFNGSTGATVENAGSYTQGAGTLAVSGNNNYVIGFQQPDAEQLCDHAGDADSSAECRIVTCHTAEWR